MKLMLWVPVFKCLIILPLWSTLLKGPPSLTFQLIHCVLWGRNQHPWRNSSSLYHMAVCQLIIIGFDIGRWQWGWVVCLDCLTSNDHGFGLLRKYWEKYDLERWTLDRKSCIRAFCLSSVRVALENAIRATTRGLMWVLFTYKFSLAWWRLWSKQTWTTDLCVWLCGRVRVKLLYGFMMNERLYLMGVWSTPKGAFCWCLWKVGIQWASRWLFRHLYKGCVLWLAEICILNAWSLKSCLESIFLAQRHTFQIAFALGYNDVTVP